MRRSGWVTLLMACVLWAGWGVSTAYAQRQGNDPLENAVRTGDYERARSLSLRHDDVPSLLVRALLSEYEGDLVEAAANLFGYLRQLDSMAKAGQRIAVAPIPNHGLGVAITDRLTRAAAPRP